MPLLITIALAIPGTVFTTVWSDDTCSTEASHTLPDSPPLPRYDYDPCLTCGDREAVGCEGCSFPVSSKAAFFAVAHGFEPPVL